MEILVAIGKEKVLRFGKEILHFYHFHIPSQCYDEIVSSIRSIDFYADRLSI